MSSNYKVTESEYFSKETEKNNIKVPIGLNVEHIMSYNFQHSINMLQELSKIYRKFCIKTSLYD